MSCPDGIFAHGLLLWITICVYEHAETDVIVQALRKELYCIRGNKEGTSMGGEYDYYMAYATQFPG